MRQQKDVFGLHGRGERAVGQVVDVASYVIAFVLEVAQARVGALAIVERAVELAQGIAHESRFFSEELVKTALARNQAKPQASPASKGRAGRQMAAGSANAVVRRAC